LRTEKKKATEEGVENVINQRISISKGPGGRLSE
jgi:hypothetical protein